MRPSSLFLLIPILFWGLSYISIKVVLRELEPVEMISARFLMAAPVLYLIIKAKRMRVWPVQKQGKLAVAAFIVFLHFWVMATGMKETSASKTAWILTTAPVFIAILAWLFLRESFSGSQWLGLLLAAAGVMVLTANGSLDNLAWIRSRGDVIVLGSCVTWALYTVATRDTTTRVHPLVATFWMTAIAGLVFVPYTLLASGPSVYFALQPLTWVNLVFLGVLSLAVSFWLWAEGLKRQTAAEVGVYLYVEPLFTMVFAWMLLDEPITIWLLIGAVLISLGVYVSERRSQTVAS
jgi:drug/metabolite transporter (DMT)-like permease